MLLGIDIGGTNTDCALIDNGRLVASCKIPTTNDNLLQAIEQAMTRVFTEVKNPHIRRVNLSTTLCTNALIKGDIPQVAVFATRGPGIVLPPDFLPVQIHWLNAVLDHRGEEIVPLETAEIKRIAAQCKMRKIEYYAVSGKFSPKNPTHEKQIASFLLPNAKHITLGHRLSGKLNFPRRLATSYFNAAVSKSFSVFAEAAAKCTQKFGIQNQPAIIKADGGTMTLEDACNFPLESVFSGPAASIMGVLALSRTNEDAFVLDIGGTTTDIALLSGGVPVLKPDGISLEGLPTLIRSIETRSIGIGGDSFVRVENGTVKVGPNRLGQCLALGGCVPTLIDACNVLGLTQVGKKEKSLCGLQELARESRLTVSDLAEKIIQTAVEQIYSASLKMLAEINAKPVYTLDELLREKEISPRQIIVMGGPAKTLAAKLQQTFSLPVNVPPYAEVANAVGAAQICPTTMLELFADTAKGTLSLPRLGIQTVTPKNFNLETAIHFVQENLIEEMKKQNEKITPDRIQILEQLSFNMIEGYTTTGKNIRVKCQIRPQVLQLG